MRKSLSVWKWNCSIIRINSGGQLLPFACINGIISTEFMSFFILLLTRFLHFTNQLVVARMPNVLGGCEPRKFRNSCSP